MFFPSLGRRKSPIGVVIGAGLIAVFSPAVIGAAAVAAPNVVTTIKPVHSIVAAVMDGVATPELLIDGAASPHSFALKPSQAFKLQGADLVFWIGESLETSLAKPMASLPATARVIELADTPGLELLPFRELSEFGEDDHDHEGEEDHADHAADENGTHEHEHDDDHAHDQERESAAGHDGHDHHGSFDPHLWLDPDNAVVMAMAISEALSKADPGNAATYAENAQGFRERVEKLAADVDSQLAGVRGKPFVVFHDAYHYFEKKFDIPAAGAISINPESPSSAEHVREIRETITEKGVVCVFSEPQFEPKLIQVVTEGTQVRSGVLDPLGTAYANGPELYESLIKGAADAITSCLASNG
ncbi:zinc ABC transporter substrate-binding protein ZnuA [Roseibium sp.]|uniref:zinc ABC transporter substrate-binding protein ZnuA n=1 Tax=Roseibium sp. TaxID=1936156 RepID=UPI003A9723CF